MHSSILQLLPISPGITQSMTEPPAEWTGMFVSGLSPSPPFPMLAVYSPDRYASERCCNAVQTR